MLKVDSRQSTLGHNQRERLVKPPAMEGEKEEGGKEGRRKGREERGCSKSVNAKMHIPGCHPVLF